MRQATLALLVLCVSTARSQDYLANDPVWLQHSMCAVPHPCIATDGYNYYTTGDSVIDNVTWTKVVREGVVSYLWQSPPPVGPGCEGMHPYGPAYHGTWLIRQEARQLRIWSDDSDLLLHEFDLLLGQTLPISYTNWNDDITVIAVDSVLIGSEMRARFELGNSWAQYLIEGVGSSYGLFEPISNFFDCGYGLDCFGLGSQSYYPVGGSGSCFVIMAVGDLRAADAITVAPNPASDRVRLSGVRTGDEIRVFDGYGRTVLRERTSAPNADLDVSALGVGVYVLTIEGLRHRLVVAR